MNVKRFIDDETAQTGTIIYFLFGIFVLGIIYVFMGGIEQRLWDVNNDFISDPDMYYSQEHWDAMDYIFKFWWGVPIFIIVAYVIYAIKDAIDKQSGRAY